MSFVKCQLCDKTVNRNNECEVCELHFKIFDTKVKIEKLKAKYHVTLNTFEAALDHSGGNYGFIANHINQVRKHIKGVFGE